MTPFIVFALPRSRTKWASEFLTYGDYQCAHEESAHVRGLGDVRSWLTQNWTGAVDTGAARWWRLVREYRPDAKIAVIRRPVDEVVDSILRLDLQGVSAFNRTDLTREMHKLDRALNRIEGAVPNVLSVQFSDMADEDTCKALFEHCLPYDHDPEWWASLSEVNTQGNMRAILRYYTAHKPQILAAARQCLNHLHRRPYRIESADGVVLQEEALATVLRDGAALLSAHMTAVGDDPKKYLTHNLPLWQRLEDQGATQIITARCNGRMLGYLASIIGPCLEAEGQLIATQTAFFASPDSRGMNLGMKMERAAIDAARGRGVSDVFMRAGIRGDGPRLGAMFKRLGAEDYGRFYRLPLKKAT